MSYVKKLTLGRDSTTRISPETDQLNFAGENRVSGVRVSGVRRQVSGFRLQGSGIGRQVLAPTAPTGQIQQPRVERSEHPG